MRMGHGLGQETVAQQGARNWRTLAEGLRGYRAGRITSSSRGVMLSQA